MNDLKCPNCDLINLQGSLNCHRCGISLKDLPQTSQPAAPAEDRFQSRAFSQQYGGESPDGQETARKTYFWYRVYCMVMLVIYLMVIGIGVLVMVLPPDSPSQSPEENLIIGTVYAVLGVIFAIIYGIALFLPRKPYNWIVGIVLIAIGMTSCCFVPACLPLLIFWIKPETKAYFGRN
ncbi:MAG: hypothetical protein HKN25_05340 [Pyrinomonadaceae bacterium]|nr:hypothetical protein [Pyrinomonadaceae bacterium]